MSDHANRGIAWQRTLEQRHDDYRRDERAVVFTTPPKIRVESRVSQDGRFRGRFAAHGPPDFAGIVAGGRPVVFDAKDCESVRWSLGLLEEHQAKDLEAVHNRGGLAFVALRLQGECFVLPWSALGPIYWRHHDGLAKRGEASLSAAIAAEIGWRMPSPGDWLGALPA